MDETPIVFGEYSHLVGILNYNKENKDKFPCIILLNPGMLHRVGPNGIYVKLVRKLELIGLTSFRFDLSNIGDSSNSGNKSSCKENLFSDINEAINIIKYKTNIQRYVLLGICSGADYALLSAVNNSSVIGLVGINGYFLEDAEFGELLPNIKNNIRRRYYKEHLVNITSWMNFILGKSNYSGIFKTVKDKLFASQKHKKIHESLNDISQSLKIWKLISKKNIHILLCFASGSTSFDAYELYIKKIIKQCDFQYIPRVALVKKADHVFTLIWSQDELIDIIVNWFHENKFIY